MSRFFRSASSSGSSTSSDEDEADSRAAAQLEVSQREHDADDALTNLRQPFRGVNQHVAKDFLLHSLLEERCRNTILREHAVRTRGQQHLPKAVLDERTRSRYHELCRRLAPLNLVSAGLEGDEHKQVRQVIRSTLDSLSCANSSFVQPSNVIPSHTRQLLATGTGDSVQSGTAWPPYEHLLYSGSLVPTLSNLQPSRYMTDYIEAGMLGQGGYGRVFRVQHRLDGRTYAVKKVPLRSSSLTPSSHFAGTDELLAEVRALSRLDHPNVVRYFSSWIEQSTAPASVSSSGEGSFVRSSASSSAFAGAADERYSTSRSLCRIFTESETQHGDVDVVFTSRSETSHNSQSSRQVVLAEARSCSQMSVAGDDRSGTDEQVLVLHMQMDVYPLTLAEHLSGKTVESFPPHCFHLDTSINILLAILDGIEYLHDHDIVHRDLKPANIFLQPEHHTKPRQGSVSLFSCSDCPAGRLFEPQAMGIRIGDFGLVAQIAENGIVDDGQSIRAVGTEMYRPATAMPHNSPRLDVYALGIIACELLCKFETQMERRETLSNVKKHVFPKHFASCAGSQAGRMKNCIMAMLSDDLPQDVGIADLRQELQSFLVVK